MACIKCSQPCHGTLCRTCRRIREREGDARRVDLNVRGEPECATCGQSYDEYDDARQCCTGGESA